MISIEEWNRQKREEYDRTEKEKWKTGIFCPQCLDVEMLNYHPGEILCSLPPQKCIKCPKCEFHAFVLA